MGLSIFYLLCLPADAPEEDAMNALNLLRAEAQRLVKERFTEGEVGRLFRMDRDEIAVAQLDLGCEPFPFARPACRPPGARDCPPEVGAGFTVRLAPGWEMGVGLCRYPPGTPVKADWKGEGRTRYDGRWFYYDYVDPMGRQDRAFVRTLLETARGHGFGVELRDEAGEEIE